jgi:hypothetical protein
LRFIFMNFLLLFSFTSGRLLYNPSFPCHFFLFPFSIRPLSSKILFLQEILARTALCVTVCGRHLLSGSGKFGTESLYDPCRVRFCRIPPCFSAANFRWPLTHSSQ